jgi:hypothetical protein
MDYRGKLIRFVTFLGGLYFFLEFVLPATVAGVQIDAYHDKISNGFTAIGAAAIGLGLINLLMVHGSKVLLVKKGWLESLGLLLGLFVMGTVTASEWYLGIQAGKPAGQIHHLREFSEVIAKESGQGLPDRLPPEDRIAALVRAYKEARNTIESQTQKLEELVHARVETGNPTLLLANLRQQTLLADEVVFKLEQESTLDQKMNTLLEVSAPFAGLATASREASGFIFKQSTLKNVYELLYQGIFVSLGSAMFALLGFYIAAAAYRAFRIRSAESGLMMGAALLVMLGQIPFGLWLWDALPDIRLWLLSVPNSAAFRAIKIGAAVAGLVMAFRMWFSIESQSFANKKREG